MTAARPPSRRRRLAGWADRIRREVAALFLAARDPRTPWYAKALALVVIAYALSPIDLIPDFIPVLGQLDDLVIVPLGLLLVIRLIPRGLMTECRQAAAAGPARMPGGRWGIVIVLLLWLAGLAGAVLLLLPLAE